MKVAKGRVVSIYYSVFDDDGTLLESSGASAPLSYLHGYGNIIPGLEQDVRELLAKDDRLGKSRS